MELKGSIPQVYGGYGMKFWTITYKYQFLVETTGEAPLKGADFFALSIFLLLAGIATQWMEVTCLGWWRGNTERGWVPEEIMECHTRPSLTTSGFLHERKRTSLIWTDSCVFRVYIAPNLKQFFIHTGEVLPPKDL